MQTIKKPKVLIALDYDLTAQSSEMGHLLAKNIQALAILLHVIAIRAIIHG